MAAEGRSSSIDLSSAPNSDGDNPLSPPPSHPTFTGKAHLHNNDGTTIELRAGYNFGVANGGGKAAAASSPATISDGRQDAILPKIRKPRKKREVLNTDADKKDKSLVKKTRASAGTAASSRKKQKLDSPDNTPESKPCTSIPEVSAVPKPHPLSASLLNSATGPAPNEPAKLTQMGFTRQNMAYNYPHPQVSEQHKDVVMQPQPTTRPSGMYDPVRSVTIQSPAEPIRPVSTSQPTQTPSQPFFNASTSPAISSIIDPPGPITYSTVPQILSQLRSEDDRLETFVASSNAHHGNVTSNAMDVDTPNTIQTIQRKPSSVKKPPSDEPTSAHSPKPARAKEQPPPLPQGSGLLSSSLFGADSNTDNIGVNGKGPSIVLHVDLKGQNNQIINFARLAEEKYGFAALYPRQAAQKERLARVAAAGAALERSANSSKLGGTSAGESGDDDVSVDIDHDSENEGDVMMSGVNGGQDTGVNSGTDGAVIKRRRRKKIEEYDQDDPFVDDSELVWEAQAATSKDGFFVYCGPLVPEGEKPAVERADGTVKRGRGRGRGGGVGSRGGRGAASAGTASEGGATRGGGPGSRGGGLTRKPRIKKADRAQMDMEKANREKMAVLAAKPAGYPS